MEGLTEGLTEALPEGLPKGPATTENREPNTENREPNTQNRGPKTKTEEGGGKPVPAPATRLPSADFAPFGPLASRLANDADREALNTVLKAAPNPVAWYREMTASLDAKAGHVPLWRYSSVKRSAITLATARTTSRRCASFGAISRTSLVPRRKP